MPFGRRWMAGRAWGAIPGLPVAAVVAVAVWAHAACAQTVVVDSAACRTLTTHTPAPDVAFRPGIDATGRAVAPADLGSGPSPVARSFVFDLNADLRRYLPAGSALFQPQMNVGRVSVGADGSVLFNGQRLSDPDSAALAAACRRAPR